jgi:hypothetical protein
MVLYAQVHVQQIVPDDVVLTWTAPDEEDLPLLVI